MLLTFHGPHLAGCRESEFNNLTKFLLLSSVMLLGITGYTYFNFYPKSFFNLSIMKFKFIALCSFVALFFTLSSAFGQNIIGATSVCPYGWYEYGMSGLNNNCSIRSWSVNNNDVTLNDNGTFASLSAPPFGAPGSFVLSAAVTCTTGQGTKKSPYVYTNTTYQATILVNAVGNVTLSSSINSLTCGPAQTFLVTATSANANRYNWGVIGGTIVTASNSNTVLIAKPACATSVTVTCTAYREECLSYVGQSTTYTLNLATTNLPSTITGPDGLCTTGPNSSAVYSLPTGPTGCTTYNWYFYPAEPGITISDPSASNPTVSITGPTTSGIRYLKCDISACGEGKTLLKRISVCPDNSPPANIYATQAGNTCYYQFNATGSCGSTWEWQINNGPIQSRINPFIALFEAGFYTVKVRTINACGTSSWRTKTFNLGPVNNVPPCMWKTDPNATYDAPGEEELAALMMEELHPKAVEFSIAPNPGQSDQDINIHCSDELVGGILEVYNIAGSKLMQKQVNNISFSVPVSDLKSGLYFFRIRYGDKLVAHKFVLTD
jgi:hypothetical protein